MDMKIEVTHLLISGFVLAVCFVTPGHAHTSSPATPPSPIISAPAAQTPAPPTDPPDHPPTEPQAKPDPRMFLTDAKYLIDHVQDTSWNGDGKKKLAALRANLELLQAAFETPTEDPATPDGWKSRFDEV